MKNSSLCFPAQSRKGEKNPPSLKLLCNESFAAQRRWASFPLCAAVIWLITSICSSRGAASSNLSAGWALSVSSRGVGSEGKQPPSALSGGILSVPYPCWVAGPEIELSETPGPQKPRLGRLVILELAHRCSCPPNSHSGPFYTSPCLHIPWALWLLGDRTRRMQSTSLCGAPSHQSLPRGQAWSSHQLSRETDGVLMQYFLPACIWWVLVKDLGAEGSQVPPQNIIQNIWTEGEDRDTHGASSSTSKMLQFPLSC